VYLVQEGTQLVYKKKEKGKSHEPP